MTIEFYYFWEIIKNYAKFLQFILPLVGYCIGCDLILIRAIICIIDSSPCLNRSDNRLDMINPVILLALCCKSLTFAFSGCFTMLVGISTVFCLETPESLFFAVFDAVLGLAVM